MYYQFRAYLFTRFDVKKYRSREVVGYFSVLASDLQGVYWDGAFDDASVGSRRLSFRDFKIS